MCSHFIRTTSQRTVVRYATKNARQDRRNPIRLCAGINNTANKVSYYDDRFYLSIILYRDLSNFELDPCKIATFSGILI